MASGTVRNVSNKGALLEGVSTPKNTMCAKRIIRRRRTRTHIPLDYIGNFFHAVNGLREVLDHPVHPFIMSSEAIMKLLYKTVAVYEQNDGRAEISLLVDALSTKIAENSATVRKYAITAPKQRPPVSPLKEWG